jgi:signal transduction histidine kinase
VTPRYELIHQRENGVSQRYEVSVQGLFVGRNADNDITLADQLVSRRHARVWVGDGILQAEDLGSRNGIEVNGVRVKQAHLHEGDTLTIGSTGFRVAKCSDSSLGQTIITPDKAAALYASIVEENSDTRLVVLYKAAQLLGSVFDLDDLLRQILDLIFEALPVRRGFALTSDAPGKAPDVRVTRSSTEDGQGPPLSNTLINHVLTRNEAMLTMDAQEDSRFDVSASIVGHDIRSAMCAPLQGRTDVVGALYVDSGATAARFTRADLELLTAIARVVGVAVENARLYQENVQRERMAAIGEATAGLGHCIKNILTGIRGGGEFINLALTSKDLKYLERGWPILSRSIDRIDMLVMNMLTFSKDREPERVLTDLNELAKEVFEVVRGRAEKYHVELSLTECADPRLEVDSRQIYRALLNLVINAVEATENTGGSVMVVNEAKPEGMLIHVTDTGAGVPPEILPKLSQAFVSSKGSSGTGLGLACTYKIAREHGGHVQVESPPGQGATFTLFLPRPARMGIPTRMEIPPSDGADV